MLFDLRGRRRRAVQVTYLILALLLGGGLVLFGIGGDVSFNVFDDIGGGANNNNAGNELVQKRVETMLTMTGAHNFIEMHPDEADAVRSFGS